MQITVEKLTDVSLLRKACSMTIDAESKISLERMYKLGHSPMRTQMFWIEMREIPSFVSVHFVRHKMGVEHYVKSLRDDRCGTGVEDRNSPVNHGMLANAEALVNMAHRRLCAHAHAKTVEVMKLIALEVKKVDEELFYMLVPNCLYVKKCYERDDKCKPVLAMLAQELWER